jgi:malonyl CoA-acyl carrier protein transacylase
MTQIAQNTKIFINPSGFVEQHYFGALTPEEVENGLKQLRNYAKKQETEGKEVLILEDTTKVTKLEFLSPKMAGVRKEAAKTIKEINFARTAIYGPLHIQVIVTTLALVAGKNNKVQVFETRAAAIKWLLNKL